MSRLRAAWSALRTGRDYSDGYMHGQSDAFDSIDKLLPKITAAAFNDHMAATGVVAS